VTVEEGQGDRDDHGDRRGLQFDRGFLSPYFVTDAEKMEAVLEDALILLYEGKVSNVKELLPLLELIAKRASPLLVVAENVDSEALATFVVNRRSYGCRRTPRCLQARRATVLRAREDQRGRR
jgi:chaperonin GroEL